MWYMRPVDTSIEVPYPPEEVFDFLDVMAHHEPFTNHMLRDWEYSGPDRGVGSKARVKVSAGGRTDTVDIEVVSAERPKTIVERNVAPADGVWPTAPTSSSRSRPEARESCSSTRGSRPRSASASHPPGPLDAPAREPRAMRGLAEQLAARSVSTSS